MSNLTVNDGTPQIIADAMSAVQDRSLPVEDRAALYGVLHQIQLRINRAIKAAKPDILEHVRENGPLGPVSATSTPKDVRWPCNDEGNWADAGVQDAMLELAEDSTTRPFIRHIPEHFEIVPAAIVAAMSMGDPAARRLYTELKNRKWRSEEGDRTYTLAVKEAPVRKAA